MMDTEMRDLKKINEIVDEVRKQCEILGGELEHQGPYLGIGERLVCSFPEPVPLTRINFKEVGDKGSLYIESIEGWNGVEVDTRGIPTKVDVEGVKGITSFDDVGWMISEGKSERIRLFSVRPAGKSKIVKKAKRIEYYIHPNLVQIVVK